MRRRTFLGMVGGASAATVLAPYVMRRAHAAFGEFPSTASAVQLQNPAKHVLEIFLYGGLSQWETLFFVRGFGESTNEQYYTFKTSNDQWASQCNAASFSTDRFFANDEAGTKVEIGPFAHRLYSSGLHERMRVVVQQHNLEPHEAAVPQALTGRPVGQPAAAGLGTHIQRAKRELEPERRTPHSYVFATGGISSDNVAAAAAAGAHPGSARPLLIKTDNATRLTDLLGRPTLTTAGLSAHDALVGAYATQYDKRLEWPKRGRVRAAKVDDLEIAFETTKSADQIRTVLPTIDTKGGTACSISESQDIPLMGLEAARHLLVNGNASYVCVSDTGLYEASGGGGYDTHTGNARDTAVNFDNMTKSLLGILNMPGQTPDPKKLNLDDTLIILNTEFGRTPGLQQGTSTGRNHFPYGYVTAFIGGPTVKGISGAINDKGFAIPTKFSTPAQNRIAAMLAMGIWPFAHEGFAVSDVPGATSELDAARISMQAFLGRTAS